MELNIKRWRRTAAVTTFALAALGNRVHASEKETAKPNILFIVSDDQRHTSLGCAGHPQIKTPIIDTLAKNGVRFENMVVNTPICMASRATIFTGLTASTHGNHGSNRGSRGLTKADIETSFPALLRQAGYQTALIGKQDAGFAGGVDAMKIMFDDYQSLRGKPYLKKMPDGSLRHVDEIIGDRSVDFVKRQKGDKPFFLYMSLNMSHAQDHDHRPGHHFQWAKAEDGMYEDIEPLPPKLGDRKYFNAAPAFLRRSLNFERWKWRWDTPEKYRINMRAYYRMLTGIDRITGRVLTALKEKGLDKNTVVIFTGDNGFYMGDRGFAGKWSHYEESLRVPLVVYDPRLPAAKRGRLLPEAVSNLDLPSTILAAAGVPIPAKYQGHDLMPLINGATPAAWRQEVFIELHFDHRKLPKYYGVRHNRYTYANYYENKTEVLYDRQKDPTQLLNQADNPEYATVLAELRQKSNEYREKYDWKKEQK